ncbi:hypothetical protein HQ584_00085 [Patescibacteria group bacterium]|nr:hypothetical protein [Patescibacteria group bacterium]
MNNKQLQNVLISDSWKKTFPGTFTGVLMMNNVINKKNNESLRKKRTEVETDIKRRFSDKTKDDIKALPIMQAYKDHYKKFNKSYHVRLQLESVILKGKSNPNSNAIVEAMFMAELKNLLLTASHDLDFTELPVTFDASTGQEVFTTIYGKEQQLKPSDMIMKDSNGVICSVIYGPDNKTRVREDTKRVLYTVYTPVGISRKQIQEHLKDIQSNVLLFSPQAKTELIEVF